MTAGALDGEKGTGKTLSLCHVIHFCAKRDWLIVHVPDGKEALLLGCGAGRGRWSSPGLTARSPQAGCM